MNIITGTNNNYIAAAVDDEYELPASAIQERMWEEEENAMAEHHEGI